MIGLKPNVWLTSNRNYTGVYILILLSLLMQFLPSSNLNFIVTKQASSSQLSMSSSPQQTQVSNSLNKSATVADHYSHSPLSFEANHGQVDDQVKFFSRGSGYSFFLTSDEAVFALSKQKPTQELSSQISKFDPIKNQEVTSKEPKPEEPPAVVRMKLKGTANPHPQIEGLEELSGKSNYFIGNDPAKWQTNISHYSRVRYKDVYPGIDMIYYGNSQGQLEYDFVLAAGADPAAINLNFEGVDRLETNERGDLVLHLPTGDLIQHSPQIYQENGGIRKTVAGHYQLSPNITNQISFEVETYDKNFSLVIDPILVYSTYLGGIDRDAGNGIAVDSSGNAYVTGETYSANFPTLNAFQSASGDLYGYGFDAFVTKYNANGILVYSTFLGGNKTDKGHGITVDSSGNIYVTGETYSANFPTLNAIQPVFGGGNYSDAFVTKFNANGTLAFSTYLGGNAYADDKGNGIAVDSSGNAYVTGFTGSANFPTLNAFQAVFGGIYSDAFVTKFNANGTLAFSTFLGGNNDDKGNGIAVDSSGNAYVTGLTWGFNFPILNAFQPNIVGGIDAFVTKYNTNGILVYSTFLGGNSTDVGNGIAVDSSGNAYVTGYTYSTNFPTLNAFQAASGDGYYGDGFVTKLNANGTLAYSTFLWGNGSDNGGGIAVDSSGNAYVVGFTGSTNFPTLNAFQAAFGGSYHDAFVTKFNANGTLAYSTYLGGNADDKGNGIAIDSSGNAYVTGFTGSPNFPTLNAFQAVFGGGYDAFVTKISPTTQYSSLSFFTQPVNSSAASLLSPQPVVIAKKADGATATDYNGPISISIKNNTGTAGAKLNGTTTVNAVNGVATFSNLSIDIPGAGYILTATISSISADSTPFDISSTTPASLNFEIQPGTTVIGNLLNPQPKVVARKSDGTIETGFYGPVTLNLPIEHPDLSPAYPPSSYLIGTTTLNATAGVAQFNDISINYPGSNYILSATSSPTVAAASTSRFYVLPLPAGGLQIPFIRQYTDLPTQSADCGPASVAMIADFLGRRPPGQDNFSFVQKIRSYIISKFGNSGETTPQQLVPAFKDLFNLNATEIKRIQKTPAELDQAINQIKNAVQAGSPVIALVDGNSLGRGYAGHYVVIRGFSVDGSAVYLDDADYRIPPFDTSGWKGANGPALGGVTSWNSTDFKQAIQAVANESGNENESYATIVSGNGHPAYDVTNSVDTGDTSVPGTLSYVLARADSGDLVNLDLLQSTTSSAATPSTPLTNKSTTVTGPTIIVKGILPPLKSGVIISGICDSNVGPTITIDGSQAPPGNGLVLVGNNTVFGVNINYFKGNQLKATGNNNVLICTRFIR